MITLRDAADLATALTLIVATVTFVLALIEHRQREREKRTQNWQKVVVYKIIESGVTQFDEIKMRYVTEAQQLSAFDLPKEEIQDDALQLALITLMGEHLISKSADDGGYLINAVSSQENMFRSIAVAHVQRQMMATTMLSKIYQVLEHDSGKFTIDQLYRVFDTSSQGVKFEDFDVLVREQIARGQIVMNPQNQTLWSPSKVPPKNPVPAQKPHQPSSS